MEQLSKKRKLDQIAATDHDADEALKLLEIELVCSFIFFLFLMLILFLSALISFF